MSTLSKAVGPPKLHSISVEAHCEQLAARLSQEATVSHLVDHVTGSESYAGRYDNGTAPNVVPIVGDPVQSNDEAV